MPDAAAAAIAAFRLLTGAAALASVNPSRATAVKEATMAHVDGGEMVARMLEREGVRNVFALVGGHLDPILQGCVNHGIRIIDTRHEQAAGHMADGWARATGRPGVAIVTAGPGVTDVVTAVANAYVDAIPMVVLGGRSPLIDDETLPLQGMDQLGIMRPITKSARCVTHAQRIPEYLAMAFREAVTGRPGPVFLELPVDVLFTPVDESRVEFPESYRPQQPPAAPPPAVEAALLMLAEAERPVILAGGGVWFSGAHDELRRVAERLHIPVLTNAKARGCMPEDHPLGLGSFTLLANPLLGEARPDAVLLLGARIGLFLGGNRSFIPVTAKVAQVDIEGEEIGRNRAIDLGIVADCRCFLQQLLEASEHASFPSRQQWIDALTAVRSGTRGFLSQNIKGGAPIHPYHLAHEVADVLPEGGILVADGGEIATWVDMAATVRQPGSWMSHGYLGCLGVGLPFGLAAKAAHPERAVLVVTGDGSVGLNFAEFDTAVRHNLPIVVVISNDQAWGMCKHGQELVYGKEKLVASELGPVHYEKAAAGFGVHAEFVERAEEIRPALERALASGRPACVNVMVDPDVISPVTFAMAGGTAQPSHTDDGRIKVKLPYYGEREL